MSYDKQKADTIATQYEGATPNGQASQNYDGDLKPDYLDPDDDGDGIYTKFEGVNPDGDINPATGITLNTDGDALLNYLDIDDDNDGYATWETIEGGLGAINSITTGIAYTLDTDTDRVPNYLDGTSGLYPVNGPFVSNNFISLVGDKRYEMSNHLGNVLVVVNDKKILSLTTAGVLRYFNADVLSYSDYYPFGQLVPNRHASTPAYRYGFNGKELDNELKGEGNSYDFGARMLDTRVGRWFARDPLESKYPNLSTYNFASNNPIIYYDFDGRDIVYFNRDGKEVHRVVTDKVHETWVMHKNADNAVIDAIHMSNYVGWVQAPMPGIIQTYTSYEKTDADVTDSRYQRFDYIIAAETFLFNDNKKDGIVPTVSGKMLAKASEKVSDLDPTIVKGMIMQETVMGKDFAPKDSNDATKDIMQANVYYSSTSNDWGNGEKAQFELEKGGGVDIPQQSVRAGIGQLFLKGLRAPVTGYLQTENWNGGDDWSAAVRAYNGSPKKLKMWDMFRKDVYQKLVFKYVNESKEPESKDYPVTEKKEANGTK